MTAVKNGATSNGDFIRKSVIWGSVPVVLLLAGTVWSIAGWFSDTASRLTALEKQNASYAETLRNINRQQERLQDREATTDTQLTQVAESLKEIETQFCDTGNVINLTHHKDMTLIAAMWPKVFDEAFPSIDPFDPVLCHKDQNSK